MPAAADTSSAVRTWRGRSALALPSPHQHAGGLQLVQRLGDRRTRYPEPLCQRRGTRERFPDFKRVSRDDLSDALVQRAAVDADA